MRKFWFCFSIFLFSFLNSVEEGHLVVSGCKRIYAHLTIQDYRSACNEAKELLSRYPQEQVIWKAYIQSLAKAGEERELLAAWQKYAQTFPTPYQDRSLLEEVAWGIIENGERSSAPVLRLISLLASLYTQDIRGVQLLRQGIHDSNAAIRAILFQIAPQSRDGEINRTLLTLLSQEKLPHIRLGIIKGLGAACYLPARDAFLEIIRSQKTSLEEKIAATQALVETSKEKNFFPLKPLLQSQWGDLRYLACQLAIQTEEQNELALFSSLLEDPRFDVRVAALQVLGLANFVPETPEYEELIFHVEQKLEDRSFIVRSRAAWLLTLKDPKKGQEAFKILFKKATIREELLIATAALAATGKYGFPLTWAMFMENKDRFVKTNLAFALIGERFQVASACMALKEFLANEKLLLMEQEKGGFTFFSPSYVKHDPLVPHYPEAVDQITRLKILKVLALLQDPEAPQAIRQFLQEHTWGVSGAAAALLLTEGEEESIEIIKGLQSDPDLHIQVQASLILALWGEKEIALEPLEKGYENANRELKEKILEGIAHIASPQSIPFLTRCLKEPFQSLRILAAFALLQCLNA